LLIATGLPAGLIEHTIAPRGENTMDQVSRRSFLAIVPAAAFIPAIQPAVVPAAPEAFPRQNPLIVKEMVGVAHGNLARVKELVSARPSLARAVWEWGYGDWESALGAASHVGNKEIAKILLDNGAHPTIFSAAMLGQIDVVRSFVVSTPGIQRTRGPHGITLVAHARAGGNAEMVKYLESLGDADPRYTNQPMSEEERDGLLGTYAFGSGPTDRLIVSKNTRGDLVMKRDGDVDRNLFHHGNRVFNPSGAEAVRIRFEPATGKAASVEVIDGPVLIRARST
jgi:hypothetical protein